MLPAEGIAEPAGLAKQEPVHDVRIREEEGLELLRREDDAAQRRDRDHVRDRGLVEEDGQLAEPVAALQGERPRREQRGRGPVDHRAVHAPFRLAVEDDVKAAPHEALALRPLAGLEPLLLERLAGLVQLRGREIGEEGDPAELVRDVDLACHPCALLPFRMSLVQRSPANQWLSGSTSTRSAAEECLRSGATSGTGTRWRRVASKREWRASRA